MRTRLLQGLLPLLLACAVGASAHAQVDCAAKRKALKAAERTANKLQATLRRLLTKANPSGADKAKLDKTQGLLGPASETVDQLEAAAKGCTGAAAKAPKKPKKTPTAKAPKKPKKAKKPAVAAEPEPPKLEPPKPVVAAPAPVFPTPPPLPPAASTTSPMITECSGGPRAWMLASAGVRIHAPANVERLNWTRARHSRTRRAVDWANEMPQRCAPSIR